MGSSHLGIRLAQERAAVTTALPRDLMYLRVRIDAALAAFASGDRVDVYLICNAATITATIQRWNTLLELEPFADEVRP